MTLAIFLERPAVEEIICFPRSSLPEIQMTVSTARPASSSSLRMFYDPLIYCTKLDIDITDKENPFTSSSILDNKNVNDHYNFTPHLKYTFSNSVVFSEIMAIE